MTDSEKIAAPAEQPAASEKPMSAAADAVETPSEPAPEKKPRRPRRKKPAVEQATLELSAPENAVPAQPVEEQSVSAPPAPEAPARKRPAPKQSAAKTARKQSEQPKQPVEAPVEPKQPEQPVLTEHPVQIPAVAASVLPAEAVASAVPAVSEPAAVPAVASPDVFVKAGCHCDIAVQTRIQLVVHRLPLFVKVTKIANILLTIDYFPIFAHKKTECPLFNSYPSAPVKPNSSP